MNGKSDENLLRVVCNGEARRFDVPGADLVWQALGADTEATFTVAEQAFLPAEWIPTCRLPSNLYATLVTGPKLPFDYQLNSARQFTRDIYQLVIAGTSGFREFDETSVSPAMSEWSLVGTYWGFRAWKEFKPI
jgi:hypothetical protein